MYNEEENIPLIYNKLLEVMDKLFENRTASFELIFINDGSIDRSLPLLKDIAANDKRVGYINFSRNFGHQNCCFCRNRLCKKGNAIVIIDADLQDPPELIIDLYNKWKEGFEVVYAQRIARKGEGVFKKMTAKLFYKIIEKITSINIPVDTGDFRLIDRKNSGSFKDSEKDKFLERTNRMGWIQSSGDSL
ncbi:MAG: glycosyltransferase family 2 protein [Chitinophagales bacterium]